MLLTDNRKQEILTHEGLSKFVDLVVKARKKNPDPSDLEEVEDMLDEAPELWNVGHGFAGKVFDQLVAHIEPAKIEQLILKAQVEDIKNKLGYSSTNQLERLIIDEIILCWTYANHAHAVLKNITFDTDGFSYPSHKHWQNNLTQCQKRYMKALETLARVRKLNINIQLNVATNGGKQVNVNRV